MLIRLSCAASSSSASSKDGCYAQRNGMDWYTAVKGSNTWWVGGSRMSGSHAQLKAQCFTSCNTAGGYKYYILHDNTACFCAKQDPTGPKDSSRCGAGGHELWTLPSASLLPPTEAPIWQGPVTGMCADDSTAGLAANQRVSMIDQTGANTGTIAKCRANCESVSDCKYYSFHPGGWCIRFRTCNKLYTKGPAGAYETFSRA